MATTSSQPPPTSPGKVAALVGRLTTGQVDLGDPDVTRDLIVDGPTAERILAVAQPGSEPIHWAGTVTGNLRISGTINRGVHISGTIDGELQISGTASITSDVHVSGTITRDLLISGTASITGNVYIAGTASITGNLRIHGIITGDVHISGTITGDLRVLGTASVTGEVRIAGTTTGSVLMYGTASVVGKLHISGAITGDLLISEKASITGSLSVYGTLGGQLHISGKITGDLLIDSTISGGLEITGAVTGVLSVLGSVGGGVVAPRSVVVLGSLRGARLGAEFYLGEQVRIDKCDFRHCPDLDKLVLVGTDLFPRPPRWSRERLRGPRLQAPIDATDAEMASVYRRLRTNLERRSNRPGAAVFYRGEMRSRFWAALKAGRLLEAAVIGLYWLMSGYGLSPWRPVLFFVALAAAATEGFLGDGLLGGTEAAWVDVFQFAIRSMVSFVSPPDLTAGGQLDRNEIWLQLGLRFFGPLLFAQFALAVRDRVAR